MIEQGDPRLNEYQWHEGRQAYEHPAWSQLADLRAKLAPDIHAKRYTATYAKRADERKRAAKEAARLGEQDDVALHTQERLQKPAYYSAKHALYQALNALLSLQQQYTKDYQNAVAAMRAKLDQGQPYLVAVAMRDDSERLAYLAERTHRMDSFMTICHGRVLEQSGDQLQLLDGYIRSYLHHSTGWLVTAASDYREHRADQRVEMAACSELLHELQQLWVLDRIRKLREQDLLVNDLDYVSQQAFLDVASGT